MTRHRRTRFVALLLASATLTAACAQSRSKSDIAVPSGKSPTGVSAQVASYDLVAGRTGRFIVGLLSNDQSRLVSFGTVKLSFKFLGATATSKATGRPTTALTARFLPIPGQKINPAAPGPRLVPASQGIGVYGAPNVKFDRPGFWQVTADTVIGGKHHEAKAAFPVLETSTILAVGDAAPPTDNPIAGAADIESRSIDSRASNDVPIPDIELHTTTIAAALAAGRPLLVVVSTPTYCQSRFCGPITDSVLALAKRTGDTMAFVHLEVWKNFEKNELNKAASEWIFPAGSADAQEPWVFVVGRDGRITHRFDNVATEPELEQAVADATR